MRNNSSSRIRIHRRRTKAADSSVSALERWKSIASIASAVAIPFVLAVVGYFIQKQLANDGLKKDYVSIAASILKENPTGQEPDLRKWAVEVLEQNSPIPFTTNAKRSLQAGSPIVVPGPALPPPIEGCMEPPKERTVNSALSRLDANIKRANERHESPEAAIGYFMKFIDVVIEQEKEAAKTSGSLKCMQSWATMIVKGDDEWRKSIGAPDSKSVYENLRQENQAIESSPATAAPLKAKN
jgi:hypothetical protein